MFISVKFAANDSRTYTYHCDDSFAPQVGNQATVDTRHGRKTVLIEAIDVPQPEFECKDVIQIIKTDVTS